MKGTGKPDVLTIPFWDGARAGQLVIPHCDSCGKGQWPIRYRCVDCGNPLSWKEASGRARLLTWSEVLRPPRPELQASVPYMVVMVELEEGARMLARLAPLVRHRLEVGLQLRCIFEPVQTSRGIEKLPVFTVEEY